MVAASHTRATSHRPGGSTLLATIVGLALVAGIALRVWVYRSALGVPDSDEAVVGLMARRVLEGELTTFFWGQGFGGSQEALLTAPVFAVAGSSWLTLRLVPIVLSGLAALVVWRVGRRTIGEPAATIAGCALWIFPPFLVYKLTHQQGFYGSGVLYTALLLLLALRLAERPSRSRAGLFGLVVGLALWQSAQLVPIVVATAGWAVWHRRAVLAALPLAVVGALVGALPALVWNLQNDWGSLDSPIENTTSYQHRLRIFVSPLLPMLLGLRTPFSQEPLLSSLLVLAALALLGGLFVYGAARVRSQPTSLLYVVAALFPFLYALAPQTLFSQEPRYLLVLSPVVVLLLAQLAQSHGRGFGLLALLLALSIVSLDGMESYVRTVPSRPPVAPRDLGPLVATLDREGLDRVYADFWLSYRLTFETDERIVAAQSKLERVGLVRGRAIPSRHPSIRYRPYEREVEASRHGFVFFRSSLETGADRSPGSEADARKEELAGFVADLRRFGYRAIDVPPFVVYAPAASTE